MDKAGHVLNIVLGLSAIGYSYLPPSRVKHYKRGLSLIMRILGLFLLIISGSVLLFGR